MGSLWGNECVQDDSATVTAPAFEWVGCFDVTNKTMQQSWRGESVQSHVITQAGYMRQKMNLKTTPAKWQPFGIGLYVLRLNHMLLPDYTHTPTNVYAMYECMHMEIFKQAQKHAHQYTHRNVYIHSSPKTMADLVNINIDIIIVLDWYEF